jgi:hypothetical protein
MNNHQIQYLMVELTHVGMALASIVITSDMVFALLEVVNAGAYFWMAVDSTLRL